MIIYLLSFFAIFYTGDGNIENPRVPHLLFIESTFYPTFHYPIKVRISKTADVGYLVFSVLENKTGNKTISSDSVILTQSDFRTFFETIGRNSLLNLSYDTTSLGSDGILFKTSIEEDGQKILLSSWSPSRDKFIDALFRLLNSKFPRSEKYIEDIQLYFDYGLPVKIKSKKPYIARFYGSISIDEDEELQRFFKKVPRRRKAIIDMTNLWGMGLVFAEDFEEFDRSHPKLVWIIPENRREYFKQFGLDSAKMFEKLDLAIVSK